MKRTFFLMLFIFIIASTAKGYDNEVVHQAINENAAKQSSNLLNALTNLGFNEGLENVVYGKKIYKWFHEGAKLEDETVCRSRNHFHDPLKPWSSAGLNNAAVNTYCLLLGLEKYSVDSSLIWAQKDSLNPFYDNLWAWTKARNYYYKALTSTTKDDREKDFAYTFRALGQVTHLIADSSVPAHVRNDIHVFPITTAFGITLGKRQTYESWAKTNWRWLSYTAKNIDMSIFNQAVSDSSAPIPISALWDLNKYNGTNPSATWTTNPTISGFGITEYTNANFFSEDTIFKDYPHPAKENTTATLVEQYAKDGKLDKVEYIQGYTSERLAAYSYLNKWLLPDKWEYNLDDFVYQDYASQLIPRAVGYSAGLLDYFFRGDLEIIQVQNGLKVKNISTETMSSYTDSTTGAIIGSISIYYDDYNYDRHLLASYELSTPLAPQGETPIISFTTPSDNIARGKYIVVFRGKLGNEEGAVIGKVFLPLIYYVSTRDGVDKIYKMGTDGSNPTVVYDNQNPNLYIGKLSPSPDGKSLAFASETDVTDPTDSTIRLLDLTDGTMRILTNGDWPNWSPDGKKIVFQRETEQYLPYSADVEIFTIDLSTGIETQLTNVPDSSYSGLPAWSPNGSTIAYTRADPPEVDCNTYYVIYLMDSAGNPIGPVTCPPAGEYMSVGDFTPSWSPDGQEIAFTRKKYVGQSYQLYKVNLATKTITKLTDSPDTGYDEFTPDWSPDGKTIAISSERDGDFDIWLVDPNGWGYLTNLTDTNPEYDIQPVFGK